MNNVIFVNFRRNKLHKEAEAYLDTESTKGRAAALRSVKEMTPELRAAIAELRRERQRR